MTTVRTSIVATMSGFMPAMLVETVAQALPAAAHQEVGTLDVVALAEIMQWLEGRLKLFARGRQLPPDALAELQHSLTAGRPAPPASHKVEILSEADVATAQRATNRLAKGFFGTTDCVRLVTVVSELARNIHMYARTGTVELRLVAESRTMLFTVVARDQGPGIGNLEAILSGSFVSRTGLGRGLCGAKAIFGSLAIETSSAGTTVRASKRTAKTR